MKSAKTLLIGLTLLGLSIAALVFARAAPPQDIDLQNVEPGSIDEMIVQALANGQSQVTIPLIVEYEEAHSFDETKVSYSVLVARADAKQSLITSPFEISTWFRFTVTETLSLVPSRLCTNNRCAPPSAVAGAAATEMLVPRGGGAIVKDGVSVDLRPFEFPDFTIGKSYLLFVDYDSAARIGAPALGPLGVFSINADGSLSAIAANSDLKNDIANRFGNSLSQVRTALGSSPPSSCNPTDKQGCTFRRGEWDDSTCSCFIDPCLRRPWLCE